MNTCRTRAQVYFLHPFVNQLAQLMLILAEPQRVVVGQRYDHEMRFCSTGCCTSAVVRA